MLPLSIFLFILPLLLLVLAKCEDEVAAGLFVKVSHHRSQIRRSFEFQSRGFVDRIDDIRLLGNAAVMADGSVKIPAPTDNASNQAGRALFASPVRMWDPNTSLPASFETEFSFAIDGSSNDAADAGGGLAFIIAPDEISIGRNAGFLGMLNAATPSTNLCERTQHPVIAVEFDTFKDAEFGDPNDNHVGINLGTLISHRTKDLSEAGLFLSNSSILRARVAYDGISQQLEVRVEDLKNPSQSQPLVLAAPVDLTAFLREYMFVGFSASTGTEPRTHSILHWSFSCASHAVQRFPVDLQPGSSECNEERLEREEAQANKTRRPPRAFVFFLAASGAAIFSAITALVAWPWIRRRRSHPVSPALVSPRPRPLHRPRKLELHELAIATGGFDEKQRIGEGPSGVVFRGSLQDGSLVVVKRFHQMRELGLGLGLGLFRNQGFPGLGPLRTRRLRAALGKRMLAATELRHSHIVAIRGWFYDREQLLIAYDYMPNGSLDKWLYPEFAIAVLPWIHRWKAALGAAAGAAYLHRREFAHRRLKASNILLDITFAARIGDFGFDCSKGEPNPYAEDVFGFGLICLELACGMPLLDCEGKLLDRISEVHLNRLEEAAVEEDFVDPRLCGEYDREQAACLLRVGFVCTRPEASDRLAMEEALEKLLEQSSPSVRSQE